MALALKRRRRPAAAISVVSMIDVLMIMLIFFMVTSTYLDLDMVPAAERADEGAAPPAGQTGSVLMVRLAQDGSLAVQGQTLDEPGLAALIAARLAGDPALQLVLLPSSGARMQDLVLAMDIAARAGAPRIRVLRLEAGQ